MESYADLRAHVEAGRVVAIVPAVDQDGEDCVATLVGELPPIHQFYLASSTCEQRARIAIRALAMVYAHYKLTAPGD